MANGDKDVAIRVSVETDGEVAEVETAARAIESLGPAASGSAPPLSSLGEAMDRLADQAGGLGKEAQTALRDLAGALRELDAAKSVEEQRGALERVTSAWRAFGSQIPLELEGAEGALKEFGQTLENLEVEVRRLAQGIDADFERAEIAVKEFANAGEKGLETVKRDGEQARLALDRLSQSANALRASGQNLTAEQQASLAGLEARYEGAVARTGEATAAQQRFRTEVNAASQAVGGQVRHIGGLDDILASVNPKVGEFALKWGIALAAVNIIERSLQKVEDGLNNFARSVGGAGNEFDGLAGKIPGFDRALAETADTIVNYDQKWRALLVGFGLAKGETSELTNLMKILRAAGIDPTGLSLDQLRQRSAEAVAELNRLRIGAAQLKEEILGSAQAIQLQQQQLLLLFKHLDISQLTAGAKDNLKAILQQLVDAASVAGTQLDGKILKIASSLGIAVTEADRARESFLKWAESLNLNSAALEKHAAQLAEHILVFINANKQLTDIQLKEILGEQIQGVLDQFERLGIAAPAAFQAVADSLGVVTSKVEAHREAVKNALADILGTARVSQQALLEQASALSEALGKIGTNQLDSEQFERAREKLRELIEQFTAAGLQIPEELTKIANRFLVFQQGLDLVAVQTRQTALGLDLATDSAAGLGDASAIAAGGVAELGKAEIKVSRDAETGRVTIETVTKKVADMGAAHEQAAQQVNAAAEASSSAAADTSDAGAAMNEAGAGAQKAAASFELLHSSAEKVNLGRVGTDAQQAGERLQMLASHATGARTSIDGLSAANLAPLLAQLDKVIAKSAQAKAALAQVEQ